MEFAGEGIGQDGYAFAGGGVLYPPECVGVFCVSGR